MATKLKPGTRVVGNGKYGHAGAFPSGSWVQYLAAPEDGLVKDTFRHRHPFQWTDRHTASPLCFSACRHRAFP